MKILLDKAEWVIWKKIVNGVDLERDYGSTWTNKTVKLFAEHGMIKMRPNIIRTDVIPTAISDTQITVLSDMDDREKKIFCPFGPERLPCSKNCALYDTDKDKCSLMVDVPKDADPHKGGTGHITLTYGPYHSETDYSERTVTYPYPWYTTKTGG